MGTFEERLSPLLVSCIVTSVDIKKNPGASPGLYHHDLFGRQIVGLVDIDISHLLGLGYRRLGLCCNRGTAFVALPKIAAEVRYPDRKVEQHFFIFAIACRTTRPQLLLRFFPWNTNLPQFLSHEKCHLFCFLNFRLVFSFNTFIIS